MKMTTDKWLIIGGVGLGVLLYVLKSKKDKYLKVFDNMTYSIGRISNFDISLRRIRFGLELDMANHTNEAINLSMAGLVRLKKLVVWDKKGNRIGEATADLHELVIQPFSITRLPRVFIELPLAQVILTVSNLQLNTLSPEEIIELFDFYLTFDVAGRELNYKIVM